MNIFVPNVIIELYCHYRHTLIVSVMTVAMMTKSCFFNDIQGILIMYLAGTINVSNQICTTLKKRLFEINI